MLSELLSYLHAQLDLLTIGPQDSVASAVDKMIKNETPVLIVLNDKRVTGAVTDRDYLRLAQKRRNGEVDKDDDGVRVEDIMTPREKLVTVTYTDTAETCQEYMVNNSIRFLPVMFSGKLHGVLSYYDFLVKPSRFEPQIRRAIFAEEGKNIVTDDYSFSLTDVEGDKIKEDLAKRVEAIKSRKV